MDQLDKTINRSTEGCMICKAPFPLFPVRKPGDRIIVFDRGNAKMAICPSCRDKMVETVKKRTDLHFESGISELRITPTWFKHRR